MNKLLVVCGPTASGKTSMAIYLANKFDGELVSADSRQVYKGMDIGTGKDIPENSKTQKFQNSKLPEYYLFDGVRVWGYDLIEPNEEFSVAQYVKIARKIVQNIWEREKLPILVGGTGFYIKGVVGGIPTATIPKDEKLRERLEKKSPSELFEQLAQLDPVKASSMNASDKKNPRRLVRAIEVARSKAIGIRQKTIRIMMADTLFVGLKLPKKKLEKAIKKRVEKRLRQGLLEEIRALLSKGLNWDDQSMQTLGYKEWKNYLLGKESKEEARKSWIVNEKNYAKRQLTWFKRNKRIYWFDADSRNFPKSVEKLVHKWHNR